ncbi:hypothetical protein PQX77_015176 [Marasmius sp. AFHP31]|nr:hypothetical protein PQX77_015176 [Marasmius sp. AFHP31]
MATIHPSRLGLVPHSAQDKTRGRSPSPPRRSSYRNSSRSRSRDGYRGGERRGRDEREDSRERERARDSRRGRDERGDDGRNGYNRRATPEYDDYKGPSDGPSSRQESMYPSRRQRDDAYPPRGGGGSDWLDSRRVQRESRTVNIWPPSPKGPARPLSPKRQEKDSKKSSKRRRYDSGSDTDTDSSEEERRRRKKEKKRRKEKEKESKRERKKHRRSRSRHKSYDDDDERDRRRRRSRTPKRSVSRTPPPPPKSASQTRSHTPMDEEEEWVVKPSADPASTSSGSMLPPPVPSSAANNHEDDSDDDVGPQPAIRINAKKVDERSYGGALLRGEGSAMAAFLDGDTDARIPRRGEIGLTSDEIADYETVGYVMSGSRHRRMNAVRMRKENQVISAEERRGILKLQKEERERREAILREEFQELVKESLKGTEGQSRSGAA